MIDTNRRYEEGTPLEQRHHDLIQLIAGMIPYDELTYQALAMLAEEMQAANGYAKFHHPDLQEMVAIIQARKAAECGKAA